MLVYKFETTLNPSCDKVQDRKIFSKLLHTCVKGACDSFKPVFLETMNILVNTKSTTSHNEQEDASYKICMYGGFDTAAAGCEAFAEDLQKRLSLAFGLPDVAVSSKETCLPEVYKVTSENDNPPKKNLLRVLSRYMPSLNFDQSCYLVYNDKISLRTALKRAREFCADESLINEIKRIYSKSNPKEFIAHPVHYRISVSDRNNAKDILLLLMACLISNNRLPSCRIDKLGNFSMAAAEDTSLRQCISCSEYATLVIDTALGSAPDALNAFAVPDLTGTMVPELDKISENTLIILLDVKGEATFTEELEAKLSDKLCFVELKEGKLDSQKAYEWLKEKAKQTNLASVEGLEDMLPVLETRDYSHTELEDELKKWHQKVLCTSVYKSYKGICKPAVKSTPTRKEAETRAYNELMELVGLNDVKKVVKQLLASHRVNVMREQAGLKGNRQSMHMIFSGNPGSAKTTVARLLSRIMAEEGITATDKLVECSRADLIGKYVGWTANMVTEKFQEAMGGVLFIDEAYSLIGEGNDFGREAISTLVQLMENNRDDVVVVFAGYPEKMREFLEQNEGLRSRIAFHLNFPDYSAEEMSSILEQMVSKKDYALDEPAKKKCLHILEQAVAGKNFGNGRFARNMVEQAIMCQALRLSESTGMKRFGKEDLKLLLAEDFDIAMEPAAGKYKPMGICL